jgi:hypothetical protein
MTQNLLSLCPGPLPDRSQAALLERRFALVAAWIVQATGFQKTTISSGRPKKAARF